MFSLLPEAFRGTPQPSPSLSLQSGAQHDVGHSGFAIGRGAKAASFGQCFV